MLPYRENNNKTPVVAQGALATAGKYSLNSWVVAKQGPAYPPMFTPLSVVFTVVLGSILLGDIITVGRSVSSLLKCVVENWKPIAWSKHGNQFKLGTIR